MTNLCVGARADHRPGDIRVARSQREAGIDWRAWEARERTLPSSWLRIIGELLVGVALAVGLALLVL